MIKLGYSFWGFLGHGIVDTPDGGRSHRATLINSLIQKNVQIYFLQSNRDLLEAGQNFSSNNIIFTSSLPDLDAIFFEYRWPIKNRNFGIPKDSPYYTPDYDRQEELLKYYEQQNIPMFVWDKDLKINKRLEYKNIQYFEPVLFPKENCQSLLFPVSDQLIDRAYAKLKGYKKKNRNIPLVYIGNQYERDESFKLWIDQLSEKLNVKASVYGNWTKYREKHKENINKFPHSNFLGRVGFEKVFALYTQSLATVLIAPNRYYRQGLFTQRIFESICHLCVPFVPAIYRGAEKILLPELIFNDTEDLYAKYVSFFSKSDEEILLLIQKQIDLLKVFSAEAQANKILLKLKMAQI